MFDQVPADLKAELAWAVSETGNVLNDVIRRSGSCQEMFSWMTSTNITRTIYTMAGWIEDPEVRRKAGLAYSLHCWSLLLMDGVIDDDLGFPPVQLAAAAHEALRASLLRLEQIKVVDTLYDLLAERHAIVWKRVKDEPTSAIRSLEEWTDLAYVKAGWLLEGYARMSLKICGREADVDEVAALVAPLGVVFTALDDARDAYKSSEAHANLKSLILKGVIDREAAVSTISRAVGAYESGVAIHPPVDGFIAYQRMFNIGTFWIYSDPAMAVPEHFSDLKARFSQSTGPV